MTYFNNLCAAMSMLADLPETIFIGQAVEYEGTAMYNSLKHIPLEKRLELPVFEDCQMGMATGLSLAGYLPICIYPRINFLLLATNQLVLHLDKLPIYGNGFKPVVFIRTAIASSSPLHPGPQHLGDFTESIKEMLEKVKVVKLLSSGSIIPAYKAALINNESTLFIEKMELYNTVDIELTQEKIAIIDEDDYEKVSCFNWYAHKSKSGHWYALTNKRVKPGYSGQRTIPLHRFITNVSDGYLVDHINRDTLDYRKENLRISTVTENRRNRKIRKDNSTGFKGVKKCNNGKWMATIHAGKDVYLGRFTSPVDAALAYDSAALKYHGEFASLNFPNGFRQ